jgi:chitin synthase
VAGDEHAVEITLPTSQADIDVAYDDALHSLKTQPIILKGERTASEKELLKQDYYRAVRTQVLLFWILTNGILAACILHGDVKNVFATKPPASATAVEETDSINSSRVARIYMVRGRLCRDGTV